MQAEAPADANRDMLVADLATKSDLALLKQEFIGLKKIQTIQLTLRFGIMLAITLSLVMVIIGAALRFH